MTADVIRQCYSVGCSIRRVASCLSIGTREVRKHVVTRSRGPKPRTQCVEHGCEREAYKRHTNSRRHRASGMRCQFHLRLYWARLKSKRRRR